MSRLDTMLSLNDSPFIIIGMHRSGTSFLSRLFHESGIMMGEDQSENAESYFFQRINKQLLANAGASWDTPCTTGTEPITFHEGSFFFDFLRSRSKPWNFFKFATQGLWGFKDPRTTFTIDYWLKNYFPNARVIHIYRNGLDVAISLLRRNHLNRESGYLTGHTVPLDEMSFCLDLWEKYVQQSFAVIDRIPNPRLNICFEKLIAGEEETVQQLVKFTGSSKIEALLKARADQKRTARFSLPDYKSEAMQLASQSDWMNRLGYHTA